MTYIRNIIGQVPTSLTTLVYGGRNLQLDMPQFITYNATSQLKKLKIHHILKGVINVHYFYNLETLTSLSLSHSEIRELHAMIFVDLVHLIDLKLDSNYFPKLFIPIFGPENSLKYLSLSACQVHTVNGNFFQNLSKLEKLTLSYNSLEFMNDNVFNSLKLLNRLFLNNCCFDNLPTNVFENNPHLKEIHLQDNLWMERVPVECFANLKDLQLVTYSSNMIIPDNQENLTYMLKVSL